MNDVRFLRAVDCGAFGEKVKESNISNDTVKCSVFFGRLLGAGKIVEYHCGKLNYSNQTTQKQVRKTYGDGVISVTVNNFSTWGFKFPEVFLD